MNNKILLSDLAQAANCSISQASRAINGKPNVAPEIRERVRQAAMKLNYRNTARRHIPNIAILKSGSSSFFYSNIIDAIENALLKKNWKWQIIDVNNADCINEFFHDGIISISPTDTITRQCPALMNLPLVVINNYGLASENLCSIDPDTYEESRLVLEHLIALGHRRIARIKCVWDKTNRGLHRGDDEYVAAAKRLGIDTTVGNILYDNDDELDAVVRSVIQAGYTAIFMIHQRLAVTISSSLHRLGVKIPEDISLVTYEIPDVTAHLYPAQTTLDFDYHELARMALEQLHKRMKGKQVPVKLNGPVKLYVRNSTALLRHEE